MITVDGQIGTDREGAKRFLGCTESMFVEYTSRRIIRPVRQGWYFYEDLVLAAVEIRHERDLKAVQAAKLGHGAEEENVIHLRPGRRKRGTGTSGTGDCKTPAGFV